MSSLGHAYRNSSEARRVLDQGRARIATAVEYADWLEGYLKQGGKITHDYDYDTQSRQVFHIIERDIDLPPLGGSSSLSIIVPKGISVNAEGLGHNNLYCMDNFKNKSHWIPIHSDTLVEMQRRGYSFSQLKNGLNPNKMDVSHGFNRKAHTQSVKKINSLNIRLKRDIEAGKKLQVQKK